MKLRSSEIIYNQIQYDSRFDPSQFVIGYQTRFNGMKEIALTSFKPGLEIPGIEFGTSKLRLAFNGIENRALINCSRLRNIQTRTS